MYPSRRSPDHPDWRSQRIRNFGIHAPEMFCAKPSDLNIVGLIFGTPGKRSVSFRSTKGFLTLSRYGKFRRCVALMTPANSCYEAIWVTFSNGLIIMVGCPKVVGAFEMGDAFNIAMHSRIGF